MRALGVALLATALLLTAACGGSNAASKATQTGGASLGQAEGTVVDAAAVGSPGAGAAAARASEIARAVATAQATAQAQARASGADPCRVATKEELEAALGFPLRPGERKGGPIGDEQCVYKAQFSQDPGTLPDVTVAIYKSRLAATTYDGLRESSSRPTDVPGLGDKAWVSVNSGLLDSREIYVLKGDVLFWIDVSVEGGSRNPSRSMNEEEKRTKLVALVRTALGRL